MRNQYTPPVDTFNVKGFQRNSGFIDAIAMTQAAINTLSEQGLVVQKIEVKTEKPVIEVKPSQLCGKLNGAFFKQGQDGKGRYRRFVSLDCPGCQVEWQERY